MVLYNIIRHKRTELLSLTFGMARASALEDATKLNVIIFDKTGTLTLGQPEVVELVTAEGVIEDVLLTAAAAVEQGSGHPLAQAILRRAALIFGSRVDLLERYRR